MGDSVSIIQLKYFGSELDGLDTDGAEYCKKNNEWEEYCRYG